MRRLPKIAIVGATTLAVCTVAAISLFNVSLLTASSVPDAPPPPAAALGDNVTFRYTMLNEQGVPLLTNQYAMAQQINRTDPAYPLRNMSEYTATTVALGNSQTLFGEDFEAHFIGRTAGETFQTPVLDANRTVTGAAGPPVPIPRSFGPFPMRETVPVIGFSARFPNATTGDVVQLNPRFHVEVERMDDQSVTYRYLVQDGETHAYPELGATAKLVTRVSSDGASFQERIDIDQGAAFNRRNDRVLNLTHGPYVVLGMDDETILLQPLVAPLFNHVFENVYFVVEVIRIDPAPGPS